MSKIVRVPTNQITIHSIPAGGDVMIRGLDKSFRNSRTVHVEVRFAAAALPGAGSVTVARITYPRRTGQSIIETTIDDPLATVSLAEATSAFNAGRRAVGELDIGGINGLKVINGLNVDITNVSVEIMVLADDVQVNPTATEGCE